jgi:Fur family ferric uptake transcriptional regulator
MTHEEHKRFEGLLEERGLKYTFERRHIFEEITHMKRHFDADSLYERFKTKGLRISRDTVYRTIPLLLESGVIQKSVGEGKREFYEPTTKGHHDHMVCVRCGKIIEFTCDEIEKLQDKVCKDHNFKLIFHDHRLFGECGECHAHSRTATGDAS